MLFYSIFFLLKYTTNTYDRSSSGYTFHRQRHVTAWKTHVSITNSISFFFLRFQTLFSLALALSLLPVSFLFRLRCDCGRLPAHWLVSEMPGKKNWKPQNVREPYGNYTAFACPHNSTIYANTIPTFRISFTCHSLRCPSDCRCGRFNCRQM